MSAVDDVYTFISAAGLAGGATGWDLVRRKISDQGQADQLVAVGEDGGPVPEMSAAAGIGDAALEDPGVLVTVRAEAWDGDASLAKAQAVWNALHGLTATTVGSREYIRVRAQTPEPVFAGFDDQGRPRHTISFRLLAEQSVA